MGDRIYRRNFLKLDGFTFSFDMTKHLNPLIPEDDILTAICKKISSFHRLTFPNWTRLKTDFRIIKITSGNELFQYLDANSQGKIRNWLIFSRVDDKIIVTHFGPFGKQKDTDFDGKVNKTLLSLKKLKNIWRQVHSSSQPSRQEKRRLNAIHKKILAEYWELIKPIEEKVEAKKKELKEVTETVFSSEEKRKSMAHDIGKITTKTGWVIVREVVKALKKEVAKEIAKVIAKIVAKYATKETVKTVSKGTSKTVVKAIPFVGLAAGVGFGIWRLVQGDVAGAGLEVASGAASCVPGPGTALSVSIDVALVAKDVKDVIDIVAEKKGKMEALNAATEGIEKELKDLFEECEKTKEEHGFVCKVLGDDGYDFDKLKDDIKVVEEVLSDLK